MKSISTSLLGIAAALVASSAPSFAQIWQQDPAFAPVIVRETDVTSHLSATADAANRFMVNGANGTTFTHVNGTRQSGLLRILNDGTIDPNVPDRERDRVPQIIGTTSDGGAWAIDFSPILFTAQVIPVTPDTTIRRLRADGSIDPDVATITLNTYFSGTLVLPDDSLIVYGFGLSTIARQSRAGIARFYPNGILDPAYSPPLQTETMAVQRAFLDGEGRVLVWRRGFVQGAQHHDLLRLTTNGVIDPTFTWQLNGVAIDEMVLPSNRVIVRSGTELRAYDFAGQLRNTSDLAAAVTTVSWNASNLRAVADGRVLVHVRHFRSSGRSTQHLVRLNADLSVDHSWPASLASPAYVGLLAIAPNGTMLLREETDIDTPEASPSRLVLATDETWQSLNHTFTRRDPGTIQQVHDLDAGGVNVWGDFTHIDGQARDGGARFLADGSLDATFAPAKVSPFLPLRDGGVIGLQTLSPTVWGEGTTHRWVRVAANGDIHPLSPVSASLPFNSVRWLAEAEDGRILYSWFDNEAELARLAWLTVDGSASTPLNATFAYATEHPLHGITGEFIWPGPQIVTDNLVTGATLLEDGSMLISTGYLASLEGQTGLVFRLNAEGSADSALALQPPSAFVTRDATFTREGEIMLWGHLSNDLTPHSAAVRLHADGTLDTSFSPPADSIYPNASLRGGRMLNGSVLLGSDGWPEPVLAADSSRAFLTYAAIDQNETLWGSPGSDSTVVFASPAPSPFPTTYATLNRFTLATGSSLITTPADRSVIAGAPVSFSVGLAAPSNASVQWFKDNVPLTGATSAHLELTSPSVSDAGSYHAVVTYPNASYTSTAAALTVAPNTTRLTNFSARSHVTPDEPQYGGFVTGGPTDRPLLIRSIGSGLNGLGITNTALLPDPALTLRQGDTVIASDFGGVLAPAITALAARLGAFPIVPVGDNVPVDPVYGSALAPTVAAAPYSAQVVSQDRLSGVALLEIYDAGEDQTRALRNVSLRAMTDTGNRVLIGGFVLQGNGPARVLIRAIGPGLADFGVPAPLADPVLKLYRHGYERAANDDWAGDAAITAAAAAVGAFSLPASSTDAALLMTLPPGAYTAQVHLGTDSAPGEALLEIYLLEPGDVSTN